MALFRQGSDRFNFDASQLDAVINGAAITAPQAVAPQVANAANAPQPAPEAPNDEELEGEGFGAQYARVRSALSEFSSAEPTNAAGASEKLRRDINSVLNIGGGGGALYTAEKNPFSDGDDDDPTADALGEMVETSQQSLKREREELQRKREQEWADMMAKDFGIDLSAEEWNAASANLKDPKKRAAILKKVQNDKGLTDQQTQDAGTMADRIFAIRENDQLSPQQKKDQLDNLRRQSPADFDNGLAVVNQSAKNGRTYDRSVTVGTTKDARAATQGASLDARDDMLAMADADVPVQTAATSSSSPTAKSAATQNLQDEKLFASAPPAGEHFAVAASGISTTPVAPKVAPAATMAAAVKPDALVC